LRHTHHAQGWGRIINVTTSFDTMLAKGRSAYGCAKAALEANTAIWAKDLDGTGVTANVVTPGGIADTGFVPLGVPREVLIPASVMGPVVKWLVSDAAAETSGCRFVARDWDVSLLPASMLDDARPTVFEIPLPATTREPARSGALSHFIELCFLVSE
jgi:3-oxoacyl-[acyl-carrier protein] reductase